MNMSYGLYVALRMDVFTYQNSNYYSMLLLMVFDCSCGAPARHMQREEPQEPIAARLTSYRDERAAARAPPAQQPNIPRAFLGVLRCRCGGRCGHQEQD